LRFEWKCGLIRSMQIVIHRRFRHLPALSVDALSTPEQFVLGVCRCWDAFMEGSDPTLAWRELAPAFAYMNVLGALCAFDCVFKALHFQRARGLRFQDTDCNHIGVDEATVLASIADLQRGMARQSAMLLRDALTPLGLRDVLPPLARIAAALDAQGHRLPLWNDEPAEAPALSAAPYFRPPPPRSRAETSSVQPQPVQ
jgi:hypothetical protein